MAWYNPKDWFEKKPSSVSDLIEKENPAQGWIFNQNGSNIGSNAPVAYNLAFEKLESVNRGVNLIVSACSSLDFDIKLKNSDGRQPGMRAKTMANLLNVCPNPYQSVQEFRQSIFTDFMLEGNFFIYFDGVYMYHLPANYVQIHPDPKTYIEYYSYNNHTRFTPEEIIHVRDLAGRSIYRGTSRLIAATRNMNILYNMQQFQESFFANGAVPGFALATDNTLSQVAKDKTLANWMAKYSPTNGAKKPIIIDSGLKPVQLFTTSFKEMDFEASIASHNVKILETLGVPPVLLDGGNQANISPNLRLFYLETIMPIVRKYVSAMEAFSGYDIEAITANVSALQPELKDIAAYNVGLVNGGIITANEAREELRFPKDKDPESDKLRVPANIAGSAVQPNSGGAPKKPADSAAKN
jgi:HK97 family phage portal protein